MTSIYAGSEDEIQETHDSRERAPLLRELQSAISRHIDEVVGLWIMPPQERVNHIGRMKKGAGLSLLQGINLLANSLEESLLDRSTATLQIEGQKMPYGFARFYGRIARRLGQDSCNRLGIKMCRRRRVAVELCQRVQHAIGPLIPQEETKET